LAPTPRHRTQSEKRRRESGANVPPCAADASARYFPGMFGINFIKVQPTAYLLEYRGGRLAREGAGLSFFYFGPTTSLVAVPLGGTDAPFIFEETTADYRSVTLQGQVTYRIAEARKLSALMDFTTRLHAGRRPVKSVNMARATLNDGQEILAVNDLFLGARGHGSARYLIQSGNERERQSSSGIILSTGLGSTGWLKSLLNGAAAIVRGLEMDRARAVVTVGVPVPAGIEGRSAQRGPRALIDGSFAWDAAYLYFTEREPFPSGNSGATLVFGRATRGQPLVVESLMPEGGIIFSDGIETDYLAFNSDARAR